MKTIRKLSRCPPKCDAGVWTKPPGPCERFNAARDTYGYYRFLAIGGVYRFDREHYNVYALKTFVPAVQTCLYEHPFLNVMVQRGNTESPVYSLAGEIDLSKHIYTSHIMQDKEESDLDFATRVVEPILDARVPQDLPPWRFVIVPGLLDRRCLVFFAYSHSIGDGLSGVAVHKTFSRAFQSVMSQVDVTTPATSLHRPCIETTLLPAFDDSCNLPLTPKYIMQAAMCELTVPTLLGKVLGIRAPIPTPSSTTWTGANPKFYDDGSHRTGTKLLRIESKILQACLTACKVQNAKFTGFIEQVVAMALENTLETMGKDRNASSSKFDRFISCVAINMRPTIGVANDTMGMYASLLFEVHSRTPASHSKSSSGNSHKSLRLSSEDWDRARRTTQSLASAATSTKNHPIALLRYLPSIKSHIKSRTSTARTTSWELSNLGQFDPSSFNNAHRSAAKLEELLFIQPANALGGAFCVNVVSMKDSSCVISLTWQKGAILGRDEVNEESELIEELAKDIERYIEGSWQTSQ